MNNRGRTGTRTVYIFRGIEVFASATKSLEIIDHRKSLNLKKICSTYGQEVMGIALFFYK